MNSAFELIKQKVSLLDAVEKYTDSGIKECGSDTFELDTSECPFCGHKNCFRINMGEDDPYFKCFSCDEHGDVIQFTQSILKLKKPFDAVKKLSEDFKVDLPKSKLSPQQQVLNTAMEYYENLLHTDTKKYPCLGGLTPLEYQVQTRKHNPEVLRDLRVGWSDGKVVAYLEAMGFDKELIKQCGLMSSRIHGDYLPQESFIYPHLVRGMASHFTFKNLSGLAFQFKKENRLNNVILYNQDSVDANEEVVIVEGENDLISIIEGGWKGGVVATNGQVSKEQIDWLGKALPGKTLVTCFDADDAGDKYRDKLSTLSINNNVKVDHIKVPVQYKDIDKYLKEGHSFDDALLKHTIHVMGGVEIRDGIIKFDGINIFEKDRCYYKVVIKNGEPDHVQISNFVMSLKHILLINEKRYRVIWVTRSDGLKSGDILIDAETKVTLRLFKKRIAEFTDGFFYGSEIDLAEVWQHVFNKDGEYLVDIPKEVGRVTMPNWNGSWIFRNCFIDRRGKVHLPDEQGVYWPNGRNRRGIRAQSITAESAVDSSQEDIPSLTILEREEEYHEAVKFFLDNLTANFGSRVQAVTTVGWCMANAFSDPIFNYYKFFPFLFIWGKFGGGKSGILKILLSVYNMEDYGATTVGSLKSGVGFERKMAYYCSLPLALDEVRNDRDTRDNYANFRKWFNRQGRAMGARDDSEKIQQRDVKSTIIFGGEEVIEESATRSRIIPIRLARMEDASRETEKTYSNFMSAIESNLMSAIGLHWIKLSCQTDMKEMFHEIGEVKGLCKEAKTRTLDIYAIVGFFGKYLASTYMPDYDYIKDLSTIIEEDKQDQDTSDVVSKFFETLDGLIASKEGHITRQHVFVKDGKLCIWFRDVYRIMNRHLKDLADGNTISANAIRKALKEEGYHAGEDKVDVGMGNDYRRRCIMLDLEKAPESVVNIANASRNLE